MAASNLVAESEPEYNKDREEQIEGLDDRKDEPFDLGDYPIDSILIRKDVNTVETIVKRIKKGRFILDPDFQRDYLWSPLKASRLIESLILRIPIPVFYLAEQKDGKIIVVDGLQRLFSFKSFYNNEFRLTGLNNKQLEGKYFDDLPVLYQERINDTNLILYILDPKAPERIRLDIFDRVNSGVPLTRQQMRNSLYCGQATRWLKSMAHHKIFQEVTTGSLNQKTMRDREFINRFCGFYILGYKEYESRAKGDMDEFLAQALIKMNGKSVNLNHLEEIFLQSMKNNIKIFGRYAFRKHQDTTGKRSVINASLFDVFSVLFAKISPEIIKSEKKQIQQIFFALLNEEYFNNAITFGTNGRQQVLCRFEIAFKAYKEFIDD